MSQDIDLALKIMLASSRSGRTMWELGEWEEVVDLARLGKFHNIL